jgi:hypothetical protein
MHNNSRLKHKKQIMIVLKILLEWKAEEAKANSEDDAKVDSTHEVQHN